jgi:hypothetical protein
LAHVVVEARTRGHIETADLLKPDIFSQSPAIERPINRRVSLTQRS